MIAKEGSDHRVPFSEVALIEKRKEDVNSAKEAGKVPVRHVSLETSVLTERGISRHDIIVKCWQLVKAKVFGSLAD